PTVDDAAGYTVGVDGQAGDAGGLGEVHADDVRVERGVGFQIEGEAGRPRALDGDVVAQVRGRGRQMGRLGHGEDDREPVGAAPGVGRADGRAQGAWPGVGQGTDGQGDRVRHDARLQRFEPGAESARRSRTPGWTVVLAGKEV